MAMSQQTHARLARLFAPFAAGAILVACGGGGGSGSSGGGQDQTTGVTPPVVDAAPAPAPAPSPAPAPAPDSGSPPAPAPSPAPGTPPATTTATFAATTADFSNPERGWYVKVRDDEMVPQTLSHFADVWNTRLFEYRIALDDYRDKPLPQSYLDALNTYFAAGRASGTKFIVRPSYNMDMAGADAPLPLVLQHIAQLKPVLTRNADVIPFFKAGFVGAYGEWWGSQNGLDSDASKLAIKNALMSSVGANTIVHFRQPDDLAIWYPGNPAAAAAARIGVHNDCYMANDTDAHTYSNGLNDPMRAYVKTLADGSAFGGETCEDVSALDQSRRSCDQMLAESAAYHVTWLNEGYADLFLDSWKSGGCFTEIGRRLGYRLQLNGIAHPAAAGAGSTIQVSVNLSNLGWARMVSKRPLVVTLRHKSSGATITGAAGDLSSVASGGSATLVVAVTIPAGSAVGDYSVELGAPDLWSTLAANPLHAVRFANADAGAQTWDAATARFRSGTTVTVR